MKLLKFMACAACVLMVACAPKAPRGSKLVLIHTNDTHSQIDPGEDGLGGVMRRKQLIDSVRAANPNVLLVDAGDAVQGTLYFYLYGGRAEQEIMNYLGVDAHILGNHEFDNGMDSLAAMLATAPTPNIATNYDLTNTPVKDYFTPYIIKEYKGRKVALLGLGLDPKGMVLDRNYTGLKYLPALETANATAARLRAEQGVDAVIALSHLGYEPDSVMATKSHGIDAIIGGHSHTTVDPATKSGYAQSHLRNADGQPILVAQAGKSGRRVGIIEIDLDSLGLKFPDYKLVKIDKRYDGYTDPALEGIIAKYRGGLDSLMNLKVVDNPEFMVSRSPKMVNFFSDFIYAYGKQLGGDIDLAIANKGGLRSDIPAGAVTKGQLINLCPFKNYVTIVEIKGSDLKDNFDIMARDGGNGISAGVTAKYSSKGASDIIINGQPLDPERIYRVATIDYLAKGGDYMEPLTRGKIVAQSTNPVFEDLVEYLTLKPSTLSGPAESRWTKAN